MSHPDLTFLLGLLERDDPAAVAFEDFTGTHGTTLRLWQRRGFVARQPGVHPVPSCPHCRRGVPYRVRDRYLCHRCGARIDPRHLCLWRLDLHRFLRWLAERLHLSGDVRRLDEQLWQLGTLRGAGLPLEVFFHRGGTLSPEGTTRLLAFRHALLLSASLRRPTLPGFHGSFLALLELLHVVGRSLALLDPRSLLRRGGPVRFEEATGAVLLGDELLGEAPPGSKEHALLACLWQRLDQYVPYGDLKQGVLERTGSRDSRDEATFCQRLKSRLKALAPDIDRVIATTNKGDGYRLRRMV